MRKKLFNINIIEMKIIEFNHESTSKKEALESAKYVVNETKILNLKEVKPIYKTIYEVKRIRKGNK